MSDVIGRLVDGLRAAAPDLDAGQIADALWLAATGSLSYRGLPMGSGPDWSSGEWRSGERSQRRQRATATSPESRTDQLFDGNLADEGRPASRTGLPQPRALTAPLELARSLKAFGRKWQTGRKQEIDLDATEQNYARTRHLTPIFRRAPERWFDVTIIVDDSPSMAIWHDTVTELAALLRQLGVFRSVRTWSVALSGDSVELRNAAGHLAPPMQLRSSTGRGLLLVVSDFLADAWSRQAVWRTLWEWSGSTPTTLVNPLPTSVWRRTGLDMPAVRATGGTIGGPNSTLRYRMPWDLRLLEKWRPLPVIGLTPYSTRCWANAVMRADPHGVDAVLVPPAGRLDDRADESAPTDEELLETFRRVASDSAFRLAVLSSPHTPVSLPMLRLLQDQFVPGGATGDIGEILAVGVAVAVHDNGTTALHFRDGVQKHLQALLTAPEAWRVYEALSAYVTQHASSSGEFFVATPDPTGDTVLSADAHSFAEASQDTLRLLGLLKPRPIAAPLPVPDAQQTITESVERDADVHVPVPLPPAEPASQTYSTGDNGVLWPLVRALRRVDCMNDLSSRNLVIRIVSDELGSPLSVDEYPQTTTHLFSIVNTCRQRPNGLSTLLAVLEQLEPGSAAMIEVRRVVTEMIFYDTISPEDRRQLFTLLAGVVIPDIGDVYRLVAGEAALDLPEHTTYQELFRALETLNSASSGIPKPVVFVEHLANRVRLDLALELRRWVSVQIGKLGLDTELVQLREQLALTQGISKPRHRADAYLVFQIERTGPGEEGFRIALWRQLDISDGWHPERTPDIHAATLAELKVRVADIIESTESEWAQFEPSIRLEFMLATELLNLDVDQWAWEVESRFPEPMGCRFIVNIRSLERMKARKWHRAWYVRWKELKTQVLASEMVPPESTFLSRSNSHQSLRKLAAQLERSPALVALVLSAPPTGTTHADEISIALRAGIPLVIWHRGGDQSEEFLSTVQDLLHDTSSRHILDRVRMIRADAYGLGPDHVGANLAVMWDDPERRLIPEGNLSHLAANDY
nr:SAV_2336 N-terminal domain-related protein [Kibdelosporangium sp. MJ126-NF4]CEL22523.1 putative serine/threonine protein kinase (regulator) [Kibdelosporangium sp. MJ126-NF4]CTQ89379.1 putative serine/threonine protein kinase (regulator) [Kibdelosporangium sp. MJ126-NF4]